MPLKVCHAIVESSNDTHLQYFSIFKVLSGASRLESTLSFPNIYSNWLTAHLVSLMHAVQPVAATARACVAASMAHRPAYSSPVLQSCIKKSR